MKIDADADGRARFWLQAIKARDRIAAQPVPEGEEPDHLPTGEVQG